ncbi:hypothetical protein ACF3DV_00655 [Chlorogloeopsis fritschii PCC 9212]|uniref:DUF4105 domain-containing protein n=1 Tax=Chlorogloeopsis fritschii PCC 6912 TaxID=211165 RepID=A0A3S0Y1L1_CHLFR|nr:hypothetical protein [Chlorogloeopsis fritschii]RUR86079.1 hypothetical protein PCC6912_09040 [Chlorogloeopsis fritschii PCC 6912]
MRQVLTKVLTLVGIVVFQEVLMISNSRAETLKLTPESLDWERLTFAHNEDERCKKSDDPFVVPAYIFSTPDSKTISSPALKIIGSYTTAPQEHKQCVDQSQYRPVLSLTNREKLQYGFEDRGDEQIFVANVRHVRAGNHSHTWYVASIPIKSVTNMTFQVAMRQEPVLGVRGMHSQIRIAFDEPVILKQQFPVDTKEEIRVNELIFSFQGVTKSGVQLDLTRGVDGSSLLAGGIYTANAKLYDAFVNNSTKSMRQFLLNLPRDRMIAYIKKFITKSNYQRLSHRFSLFGSNCNSNQYYILDKVMNKFYTTAQKENRSKVVFWDPDQAQKGLKVRGLLVKEITPHEREAGARVFLATFGISGANFASLRARETIN